ncbi:MAG TPA: hypothetical protein VGD66_05190 [Allosphingosinicella sp.]
MRHDVHFAGRDALADAGELIESFGDYAASEAVRRASRSRELGNVIHFCRWRQVERMIVMLRDDAVTGAVH